jgi:hypothetical protein
MYVPQDLEVRNGSATPQGKTPYRSVSFSSTPRKLIDARGMTHTFNFDHVCDQTAESEELFEVGICLNAYPLYSCILILDEQHSTQLKLNSADLQFNLDESTS